MADKTGIWVYALDIALAKSVGVYFRLSGKEMNLIIEKIKSSVASWQKVANEIGILRSEQLLMSGAFKL